jgi:nucleotide-binding universal stress UspA family protein
LQRVLVPVDFSQTCRQGVAFAAALGEKFHAGLHVLHVVEPPALPEWGYAHLAVRDAKLRRAAEEKLPTLAADCGINPALVLSTKVGNGEADAVICEEAAETDTDLIVLASHGLGRLPHVMVGSTTLRVVRHAPCPVLTVRDSALAEKAGRRPAFNLKRILVTTDFSDASKKAFPYAAALARKFEAALILLYVVPGHLPAELSHIGIVLEEKRLVEEARERLPEFRTAELDPHLHVETLVRNGPAAAEICGAAKTQSADLIVMSTRGRTGLRHFLVGSVTEDVVRQAPCPVLVVREREHEFVKSRETSVDAGTARAG